MARAIANKSAAPPTRLAAPENLAGARLVMDPFVPALVGVEAPPACELAPPDPVFGPAFDAPIPVVAVGLLLPTAPMPAAPLLEVVVS